jgi:hypothetical protein
LERKSLIPSSRAFFRSKLTEGAASTVATFRMPRLWVMEEANSRRCQRFMGAPLRTRRWGRQFRGSTCFFNRRRPARVRASQIPMRTSPQAASNPCRSNRRKIARTMSTATTVTTGLMRNITPKHPAAPRRDNDQWTLKRGRNEGLWISFSIPAEIFRTP